MKVITKKQMKSIIGSLVSNQMIALDALDKASVTSASNFQWYADSVKHLFDNNINIARIVGGIEGVKLLDEIVTNYKKTKEL